MAYLEFDIEVYTWVTSEADPDDKWDRDSTDGDVTVTGCRLVREDGYNVLQASFDVHPGDPVWLVWAQYSTGDSFGRDGGQYELCSVFDSKVAAESEVKRLQAISDLSVPWTGYFEALDFIKAEEFEVKL